MATFLTTIQFTEQGARTIDETCDRATDFKAKAKKMGVKVREVYWTLGPFDGVILFEAPDDETATRAMLYLSSLGNVRTQTVRAYVASEMEKLLRDVPQP